MSQNPITGREEFPGGPANPLGAPDLQLQDLTDLVIGDDEYLYFGDDRDVKFGWDGDNLDVIVTGRTITGEDHVLDIAYDGTLSSGDSMVGCNVAVTPAGTGGTWVSAFYGKVTQTGTKAVNGYISAAEFEVVLGGSYNPSDWAVLVLNATDNNTGGSPSRSAYIYLRDYGSRDQECLMRFYDESRASASDSVLISQATPTPFDTTVRCMVGTTPVWLYGSTVGPASLADLKWLGSTANNYVEWDASADRLNVVVAGRAVTGEEHALDVSHIATVSSGDSLVAANFAVAPTGSAASWVSGLFAKATQASKVVNGYICAAEFELNSTAANASDNAVVVLNSIRNHTGSPPACDPYILLRDYGTTYGNVFVRVMGDTGQGAIDTTNSARLVTQVANGYEANADCAIRCMVGSTAIWLIASSTAPS